MSGIVNLSEEAAPEGLTVDVAVIGSGAAGATAARTFASAGLSVAVFEEGADLTGSRLTQRDGEMYDQLYMDRGGRSTRDLGISVLQGRALGGGTVINAADVVPVSDDVLEHWQKAHALNAFSPENLRRYRELALMDLSANTPDERALNKNNQLLRAGALSLGLRGEVMQHNRVGCAGVGACLIGCPVNAKRNARFVAIPEAISKGAIFFTRARVRQLSRGSSELKHLTVAPLYPLGYHERAAFTVRARTVALAASAISSAQLLLRSGLGNAHVGRHLMLQPQLPVTALFDEEVRLFRGIPQSFAVTEYESSADATRGWWGYRIESIGGTPGIVGSLLPSAGLEGKKLMAAYSHLAAALVLFPDAPQGQVLLETDGRPRIEYSLDEEQKRRMREGAKSAARIFLAAGAREVLLPTCPPVRVTSEKELSRLDAVSFAPATTPILSAHQMGTVRMATSEKTGAANPEGELFGEKGIYVLDSSLFPSSASSHIMAPIMTIARFLAEGIVARLR